MNTGKTITLLVIVGISVAIGAYVIKRISDVAESQALKNQDPFDLANQASK